MRHQYGISVLGSWSDVISRGFHAAGGVAKCRLLSQANSTIDISWIHTHPWIISIALGKTKTLSYLHWKFWASRKKLISLQSFLQMTFVKLYDWRFDVQVQNERLPTLYGNYPQEFAKNNVALFKDDHRCGHLGNATTK